MQCKVHFYFFLLWRCCSSCCTQGATNESIQLEACGRPACREEKEMWDSLFSLCACLGFQISQHHRMEVRGMLESTSIASSADQKLAHTLTQTHQTHRSKELLPAAKGYNTNQHSYDLHSSRPSFSTHLIAKQSACVNQQLLNCELNSKEDTTALNAST